MLLVCKSKLMMPVFLQVLTAAFPKLTTLNLDCVHLDANVATLAHLTSLEQLRLRRVILAPLTCSDIVAQPLRGAATCCHQVTA